MKYLIGVMLALILQGLIIFSARADKAPDKPPSPSRGSDRRDAP